MRPPKELEDRATQHQGKIVRLFEYVGFRHSLSASAGECFAQGSLVKLSPSSAASAHTCATSPSAVATRRIEVLCALRSLGARLLLTLQIGIWFGRGLP